MKERTRGKKGRSNKKGKLVAYRKREEFLKMVLSLYIYICAEYCLVTKWLYHYKIFRYGKVCGIVLAWYAESTIHESYGIFCSWLVETTLVVNIRRLILLNLRDLESSEAVAQCVSPSKKNNTHLPNLPEFNKSEKKNISWIPKKHSNQPTNLPLSQPLQIAILYHPKTRTMSLAESRSNLGFSPPRWLVERSQFDEGCYRWVLLLENALRLKCYFYKKSGSSGMGTNNKYSIHIDGL